MNSAPTPSLPHAASQGGGSSYTDSPPSSASGSSPDNSIIVVGVVAAGIFFLALVMVWIFCTRKKKKQQQQYYFDPGRPAKGGKQYWNGTPQTDHVVKLPPPPGGGWGAPPAAHVSSDYGSPYSDQNHPSFGPPSPKIGGMVGGFNKSQFTYEELAAATGGFSQANLLGQGGFGYVHKGVLPDGRQVAVKSLKSGSGQGERDFQAEVEIISRVHHRHLVSLVGYCISDRQRMLVYEYVPNKTLEFHLHGSGQPVMDWPTRLRIALGSAKGLAYLHEDCNPRIIHRDIKSANILLDDKYEAMVADFGLAKLTSDNYTHVSTRVMGTFGYLAPEYASSGKLTEKSDVFSYGVMLLELITGRRPVDLSNRNMVDSLVDWARPIISKGLEDDNYNEIVDPRLEGNYDHSEMARIVASASACIRHSARRRPKMSQIVRALEGISSLEDLNEVPKKSTSTSTASAAIGGNETLAYDTGMYNADMMKFRKMVLTSQEFAGSEDGVTSEYGLNPSASSSEEFGSKEQTKKAIN